MNTSDKLGLGCILMIILIVISVFISVINYSEAEIQACKSIGFKTSFTKNKNSLCEDSNGDMHSVVFDCKGVYKVDCIAKRIIQ